MTAPGMTITRSASAGGAGAGQCRSASRPPRERTGCEIVPGMATTVTVPPFSVQVTEQVCRALADAVTGSQIPNLLVALKATERPGDGQNSK